MAIAMVFPVSTIFSSVSLASVPATARKPLPLYPTFSQDRLQSIQAVIESNLTAALDAKQSAAARRRAIQSLLQLRKRIGKPRYPRLEAALAQIALSVRNYKIAWQFVNIYAHAHHPYDSALARGYIAAGSVLLAMNQASRALNLCNWVAEKEQGINQIRAAEVCGLALQNLLDYKRSIESFHFALAYMAQIGLNRYHACESLMQRIQGELSRVRRLEDIKLYGPDFVLYRKANRLRFQGNFQQAAPLFIKLVRKYPTTPYATAGKYYYCLCLIGQANQAPDRDRRYALVHRAQRYLTNFCQRNPYGLYRTQALLTLGRTLMQYDLNVPAATHCFSELAAHLHNLRHTQKLVTPKLKVKPAAVALVTPPRNRYQPVNFWGMVHQSAIRPGQLLNRLSASWLMNKTAQQCVQWQGFLEFLQGHKKRALAYYHKILKFNAQVQAQQTAGEPNVYLRLIADDQQGYMIAHPPELRLYHGRLKTALLTGDFFLITKRWKQAALYFPSMLAGDFGRLSPIQRDYPHFAWGYAMFMHWPDDHGAMLRDSMRQFLIVVKANHPTLTRYRAALSYGNAGADSDNPAIRKQARAMLRELMDCGVKNQYTQYARMNLAIDFFNRGHHQRAFTLMATFHKSDGVFYAMSRYWLKRFDHSYKSRASANSGGR